MLFVKLMPWNMEDNVPSKGGPTYVRISTITEVRHCCSGRPLPAADDAGYHTVVDIEGGGALRILGEPIDVARLIEESAQIIDM